jgi:hypothetical protein
MPFILEPRLPLGSSFRSDMNFMWKDDKRPHYVMDNHRGALWAWLRELAKDEPYVLIHADSHWDDVGMGGEYVDLIQGVDGGSLESYLALSFESMGPKALVRWDNYLRPVATLRPELRRAVLLARAEPPPEPGPLFGIMNELAGEPPPPPPRMPGAAYLEDWDDFVEGFSAAASLGTKVLINLDIDYFFLGDKTGQVRRVCDDSQIEAIVQRLHDGAPEAIWTVAWSPECCGSWSASAAAFATVARVLRLNFPTEALDVARALPSENSGDCWNALSGFPG